MEPLSANDPRMIGEFRLHARLGAGGMGQVYLGFSPAGHAVAIKVIHPQFTRDQEFLRRFSHEVAAASAVGGMYTAPVVDYDLTSATPWLATAYVPGPTLATVIHKHGPLPEEALWRLAAGLAEALRAVHAKGLIHRDLKPANVLLADNGPHVIDFGISRASGSMTQLTSAGMAIGTPGYMSPEQAQVQSVGPPSDVFSLGCVLAYAATGTPPFDGDNPASILFKIVGSEPDLSPVSPGFRRVIQACLRKNPAERPTPGQLIAMINELGPATPVTLGSFWPRQVARIIAVEQAAQTPAGLTPPGPLMGATLTVEPDPPPGTAGLPGLASPAGATAERTPTALETPTPGPGAAAQVAASQVPGATGHAPMIADGYYAAAQRRSPPAPAPSAPSVPPMPAPPQSYSGQQPRVAQPPGGQAPSGQVPPGRPVPAAPYPGQAPSYGGQAPPYQGQMPAYPGPQRYLGQQPGAGNPMPPYAPGRRKPMPAEVPQIVHTAIRLMYAGLAVTVLDFVMTIIAVGWYGNDKTADTELGRTLAASRASTMEGAATVASLADLLGLACWIWLAMATRRGHSWTRVAGAVLLGIYSIVTLILVFATKGDAGAVFTTVVVWVLGVASLIPLWSQQAHEFFLAWRSPNRRPAG